MVTSPPFPPILSPPKSESRKDRRALQFVERNFHPSKLPLFATVDLLRRGLPSLVSRSFSGCVLATPGCARSRDRGVSFRTETSFRALAATGKGAEDERVAFTNKGREEPEGARSEILGQGEGSCTSKATSSSSPSTPRRTSLIPSFAQTTRLPVRPQASSVCRSISSM